MSTIEPVRFDLTPVPGLAANVVANSPSPGLYVVVGRNNAGKTRLLQLIRDAGFIAAARPSDYPFPSGVNPEWAHEWSKWGDPFHVAWPRAVKSVSSDSLRFAEDGLPESFRRLDVSARNSRMKVVHAGLAPHLRCRPAVLVPTNRLFMPEARFGIGFSTEIPGGWASVLGRLEHSTEAAERSLSGVIAAAFEEITEGLTLHCRAVPDTTSVRVQVAEPGGEERHLAQCGDGLRDLAAILLFVHHFPESDLLLEEPGLRLHPIAQRRLMGHLEGTCRDRAIWMSSHEGAFIGSPSVARRFEVRRIQAEGRSEVTALLDQEGARRAVIDLGWTPQDAFLAERVLFGEGDSDVIAFRAALRWLTIEGIRIEGTLLADLGGAGFVFEGKASQAERRVELAKQAAPHMRLVALIDSDGRTQSEFEAARERLGRLGISVTLLPCVELENLWLEPELLTAILREHAAARDVDGRTVETITSDTVAGLLQQHDIVSEKGSSVLAAVAGNWHLNPGKTEVAELAVRYLRDLAPESVAKLTEAVRSALKGDGQ